MNTSALFTSTPLRASDIIGTNVANAEGDGLGTIKDIVLDPLTFKVAYVVMASGGFFRMSGKLFAMPFRLFKYDAKRAQYILDLSKQQLEEAPGFDPERWPSMADEQWHRDVFSYYGYQPWWE